MFTPAQVNTIARRAHHAVEGGGSGHTVYKMRVPRGRYVVGGVATIILPVGEAVARIRERVSAMLAQAEWATTLGYWEHEGSVYVDAGRTYGTLAYAVEVALERGEMAIYDRTMNVVIPVGGERGRL